MDIRPKTIILDIDGTLLYHHGTLEKQQNSPPELLPGVLTKLHEWDQKGYRIILLTGRRESMRAKTEEQLRSCGLWWDQLIMGVGGGVRVLINDAKSHSDEPTAVGLTIPKNVGLEKVNV